ncbi:nitroreductase family protein [Deltaproteobacteria bacterium OttesenSCG-928-K17]|nr:nitroreductase family protein [Deltaproteobacteria bacterium OttesenSCG-928-K17]
MDFLELCQRRQSCRDFADKPVEHEKLVKCLEAARLCPSGCNSQPWSFVVAEDPAIVPQVAKCAQQMGINEYVAGAKAFIVVLEEHAVLMPSIRKILDSQYFAKGDLGCAVSTICYAAEAQGLGTCILGIYDRETLGKLLGIPADKQYAGLIAVGYPASDRVREKNRKALSEIARFV